MKFHQVSAVLAAGLAFGMVFATTALAADAGKGAKVFNKCKACHSLDAGVNKVGPSLAGIVDRPAGIAEGYSYSDALLALAADGLVWDVDNLDGYLTKPKDFLPGGKMVFVGLSKPADRENLIAFLEDQ